MIANEHLQVFTPGRGIDNTGISQATRDRGLVTSQIVKANLGNIVAVDFSGKYHFAQEPPNPEIGTEAFGMFLTAVIDDMPLEGHKIHVDEEADDTVNNYLVGLRRGYLDPLLETIVPIHRDHWPRVEWLGGLLMPSATLRPAFVKAGYTRRSAAEERVLLVGYKHVMRNIEPGDLNGVETANAKIRATYLTLQDEDISRREKIGYLWQLLRTEG
jgi:hypothetical protein